MKVLVWNPLRAIRPKVTPDPAQAAELERKRDQLAYSPETAFHRDRVQKRAEKKA